MERVIKRFKPTNESVVVSDIASTFDEIVDCLESISSSYSDILRRNRVVVTYLQNLEERKCRLDQDVRGVEEIDHSLSQDDT